MVAEYVDHRTLQPISYYDAEVWRIQQRRMRWQPQMSRIRFHPLPQTGYIEPIDLTSICYVLLVWHQCIYALMDSPLCRHLSPIVTADRIDHETMEISEAISKDLRCSEVGNS